MKDKKIYIAGHRGMVGSAIHRKYASEGYTNIVTRTSGELNLIRQDKVEEFFEKERPQYVVVAAAKVGGILANSIYRAQFLYENLMIESNIIHAAYKYGAEKLLFLGSSCIYPKLAPQPLKEEYLLTSPLEETNEPYAIAKIAGIKLCESYYRQYGSNFISVMPTNLYGPFDNYDLKTSHVMPALIRKFHEAKVNNKEEVEVWGTGTPLREFLYVDDLADACYYVMQQVNAPDLYEKGISQINIGTGEDLTIAELVTIIADVVGFEGKIKYDTSKPDGTPRKLMDISRLHDMGWHHTTGLKEGIGKAYEWFLGNQGKRGKGEE
ncbi:MAG: GDP-L-fucose synthase [Ignavibacteria bacterium]|jgi:GDP-L-fucose synthase|nr:GDP-L-fucose synthase [Ignavibacteria bacterium]MCU7503708.1 GDP-L-fucose synthase [Ignavibacteria bacterium]MCU7517645.1 GDP-L-fucose synthase [Ignavibacteria bacterium]